MTFPCCFRITAAEIADFRENLLFRKSKGPNIAEGNLLGIEIFLDIGKKVCETVEEEEPEHRSPNYID